MKTLKIVENRNKFFIISGSIFLIGLIVMIVNLALGNGAFKLDVEFSGGTSFQVDIGQDFDNNDIIQIIKDTTGQAAPQVQKIIGTTQVAVKMQNITTEQTTALTQALQDKYNLPDTDSITFNDVSATVGGEMTRKAILAVVVAAVVMLIYISIRFKDLRKGGSTIVAVLHDILLMLVAYIILRIPLNYAFIAAILTILGYSVTNTIVIFDRVRENQRLMKSPGIPMLVDTSVTQTMRRSIFTSLTVIITLLALYILGVSSIRDFALPLIIGVIGGTYSSVCLAGSLWFTFSKRKAPAGKTPTGKAPAKAKAKA